jgi:hypothetical protein
MPFNGAMAMTVKMPKLLYSNPNAVSNMPYNEK